MTVDVKVQLYHGHDNEINCCTLSSNEQLLVTASDDCSLAVWNAKSKKHICSLLGHTGPVNSCTFNPGGKLLASGSYDGTVKIWEMTTADCIKTLSGHSKSVEHVAFSPDGSKLASGSWDKTAIIWNVESGEIMYLLQGHASCVRSCCFSFDNVFLATGSWDYTVRLWKLNTNGNNNQREQEKLLLAGFKPVPEYAQDMNVAVLHGHLGNVNSVIFSKAGILASASWDCTIILWNPYKAVAIKQLTGHSGWVQAISFSQNSLEIMSASDDGTMRVWNVLSGESLEFCQETLDTASNCFFSPSGSLFVAGSLHVTPISHGPKQSGNDFEA